MTTCYYFFDVAAAAIPELLLEDQSMYILSNQSKLSSLPWLYCYWLFKATLFLWNHATTKTLKATFNNSEIKNTLKKDHSSYSTQSSTKKWPQLSVCLRDCFCEVMWSQGVHPLCWYKLTALFSVCLLSFSDLRETNRWEHFETGTMKYLFV